MKDLCLLLQRRDGSTLRFPLREGRTTIGRAPRSDVRIPIGAVLPLHCEIRGGAAAGFSLHDLGSPLGTRVNGAPARAQALTTGDLIEIGPVRFVVAEGGGALIETFTVDGKLPVGRDEPFGRAAAAGDA